MGKRFNAFDKREKFARCASRLGSKKNAAVIHKSIRKTISKNDF